MKKLLIFIIAVGLISTVAVFPAFAATSYKSFEIYFKDDNIKFNGYLINNAAYISFRELYKYLKGADISWNSKQRQHMPALIIQKYKKVNDNCIKINNKSVHNAAVNLLINNRIYIPNRSACEEMGYSVLWNKYSYSVELYMDPNNEHMFEIENNGNDQKNVSTEDYLYWLSRIIHADAYGQPFNEKLAVGNVVMNRVKSSEYPDTEYDVIFDEKFGTQFTPAKNGSIYSDPDIESIEAARIILDGYSIDDRIIL